MFLDDDDDCLGRLFFFENDESVEDHEMRLAERALLGVDEKEEPLSGLVVVVVLRFEEDDEFFLPRSDDFLESAKLTAFLLLGSCLAGSPGGGGGLLCVDDGDTDFLAEERDSAPLRITKWSAVASILMELLI